MNTVIDFSSLTRFYGALVFDYDGFVCQLPYPSNLTNGIVVSANSTPTILWLPIYEHRIVSSVFDCHFAAPLFVLVVGVVTN